MMADNLPPTSLSDISTSSSSTSSSGGQSLRWSLHNFPVPVQLQPRIPRSPLSVAQELLPNFPSQLMEQRESPGQQFRQEAQGQQEQPHQYYLSLQQQMQQQLQQQFQRQLQLNLQGGGESSRGISMPDPPDTTLDIDLPGGIRPPVSSSRNSASANGEGGGWGGLRGALNPSDILEAFFSNNANSHSASAGHHRSNSSESGLVSRHVNSSSSGSAAGSHHPHSQRHLLHHHHHHGSSNHLGTQGTSRDGNGNAENGSQHVSQAVGGMQSAPNESNETQGNNPGWTQSTAELSLLFKWLTESGIFVILLLLHFLYDHRLGLLVFLCTGGTFYYTNMKLVHTIHLSAVRDSTRSMSGFLNLLWLSGFLLANIIILYYVFADQKLWGLLFYQMAAVKDVNVWTLLWCVVMTDYIIKFFTVISKAVLALLQPCFHNYRQRGKFYLLIESISQLYRQSVTIVPWLFYLNDSTRTSLWFAFVTEAVYLGFKGWSMWKAVQFVYSSFQQFQSNTSFGKKPSSSDLLERGSQCPICQDSVSDPVMLQCKHIFCEQCVSIWFDREKTCPMCRAQITTESPLWKDGNTSAHLQWH